MAVWFWLWYPERKLEEKQTQLEKIIRKHQISVLIINCSVGVSFDRTSGSCQAEVGWKEMNGVELDGYFSGQAHISGVAPSQ